MSDMTRAITLLLAITWLLSITRPLFIIWSHYHMTTVITWPLLVTAFNTSYCHYLIASYWLLPLHYCQNIHATVLLFIMATVETIGYCCDITALATEYCCSSYCHKQLMLPTDVVARAYQISLTTAITILQTINYCFYLFAGGYTVHCTYMMASANKDARLTTAITSTTVVTLVSGYKGQILLHDCP